MSASNPSTSKNAEDYVSKICELRERYEVADGFAREVSEFTSEIAIPAHNELRYAGHHLLQAFDPQSSVSEEQLRRANSHCERAMYEAAEAGIASALDSINTFKSDYRNVVIREVVSNFSDILTLARNAQTLLKQGRAGKAPEEAASEYMDMFRALRTQVDALDDSRDDLNIKLKQERRNSRLFIIGLLALIAAVLRLVYPSTS
ncbi:MAG: hypothetical protein OXU70_11115 [Gammaproteobacteria bacterium]|nr:hypothetical protein [Gammaproteobacteria bacterium]